MRGRLYGLVLVSETFNISPIFYVYAYLRKDGTPYYIGKGSQGRINQSQGRGCGKPPEERRVKIKENLGEKEAFELEIELICTYGRKGIDDGGILHNKTIGGGGSAKYRTEEERKQAERERTRKFRSTPRGKFLKSLSDKRYREKYPEKAIQKHKEYYKNNRDTIREKEKIKRATPEAKAKKSAQDKAYREKVKKDPVKLEKHRRKNREAEERKRRKAGVPTKDEASRAFKVVSPEGKIYEGRNCKKFAEEHGLKPQHFRGLVVGEEYQCKGWIRFGWKPPENIAWNGKRWYPLSIKNNKQYKFKVVSPDGIVHEGCHQRVFAKGHGLCYKGLNAILKGYKKSHKGWKKYQ